jgi:hypothetical protein
MSEETKPVVAEKPKAPRAIILNPQRMNLAEQLRQDWVVNAEEGTTVNDVISPGYWAHMASQMQPYDRVDVRLETGEWLLELIVLAVGRNYAQVFVAQQYTFAESKIGSDDTAVTHKVVWKGPQHKHAVIRIADGAMIQEGFSKQSDATIWMENHIKVAETT